MNYLEPIETFEGGGMVLQGDTEVGPARYYLVVQREMLDAGHQGDADAEKPGPYRISGLVELLADGQFGARFDLVGETLTLRLEDDRRLDFVWTDLSGEAEAAGAIYNS